jgi:extracellular elastinolytic metalloproteinase
MKYPYQLPRLACLLCVNVLFFLSAKAQTDLKAVLEYVKANKAALFVTDEDISNWVVADNYVTKHNGARHIYLQQTKNGIPIENAILGIHIAPNGRVLSSNSRFTPKAKALPTSAAPAISPERALGKSFTHLGLNFSTSVSLKARKGGATQKVSYSPLPHSLKDVTAELMYINNGKKGLQLVWKTQVETVKPAFHDWHIYIDAASGEIVQKKDAVLHCSFGEAPHCIAKGKNNHHSELSVPYASANILGTGTYKVYPLGIESPIHGARELVVDPAHLTASPYGWHDDDGQAGAEYTITRGNNVLAQDDQNGNNGLDGFRPDGGTGLTFDFTQDLNADPLKDDVVQNLSSSITNLFYWNNIMHDVWYMYGFDEPSGNFQANNYGKGGQAGDYVFADGQDGGGTDNANFSSGSDGQNGRMQMYMWSAPASRVNFEVTAPQSVAGIYTVAAANFGSDNFNFSGEVVIVDDGSTNPTWACSPPIQNDLNGKIALIDRGVCQFGAKCLAAQNAGAIAVIVCNNQAGDPFSMTGGDVGGSVNIPCMMIGQSDCSTIRVAAPFSVSVSGQGGQALDGSFDNGVVAHEYGHGISTRLTGGPSNSGCLNNDEQAGEGWSDYFDLVMTHLPDHTRNTARGIGTYAAGQATTGGGIRTHPYSTDMSINPHTYNNIKTESIPHGVGSVFCVMLWDLYWNLIDKYGYDPDIYAGTGGNNICNQLVIDGMKLQPCSPGFVDMRDAILEADRINNQGENECLIWRTFARRGLGYSASQGSSASRSDGQQAFDVPPGIDGVGISKTSDIVSALGGDTITYTLIMETKCEDVENISVTDTLPQGMAYVDHSASGSGLYLGNGIIIWPIINSLQKGTSESFTYKAVISPTLVSETTEVFFDNIENGAGNWTKSNTTGLSNWRIVNTANNNRWFAEELEADPEATENQYLRSKLIQLGGAAELSFMHSYNTETGWDGGKVEISVDKGRSWIDLGPYMTKNGYNSYIADSPGNKAFSGNSNGTKETVADLSAFCGESAYVRFNFYYDQLTTGNGWYVDNVRITTETAVVNKAAARSDINNATTSNCVAIQDTSTTTTPVINIAPTAPNVSIYPNPTRGNITIDLVNAKELIGKVEVELFDLAGRQVLARSQQINAFDKRLNLDVSNLPNGLYSVRVKGRTFLVVEKLVVSR